MTLTESTLRIGPAERLALRTAHAAVSKGPLAPFGSAVVDTAVFGLAHAGLLRDAGDVADIDRAVRARVAADIEQAIGSNARIHPDDEGQAAVRRGMRAAQRLVGTGGESLHLLVYRAARVGGITLGTYLTASAARRHCVADARNGQAEFADLPAAAFEWSASEVDPDEIELDIRIAEAVVTSTPYTVTTLRILAEFDLGAEG